MSNAQMEIKKIPKFAVVRHYVPGQLIDPVKCVAYKVRPIISDMCQFLRKEALIHYNKASIIRQFSPFFTRVVISIVKLGIIQSYSLKDFPNRGSCTIKTSGTYERKK